MAGFGAVVLAAMSASAQTTNSTVASAATPEAAAPASAPEPASIKLPYGVEDVLKLNRAQISEDIILNYVQNSGTAYNLAPNDIVYLRNQGVSDRVVTAMLDQRKRVAADMAAAQQATTAVAPTAPAPIYPDTGVAAAPSYAPTYEQPQYVQPQPEVQPAPSTVYVIPDPSVRYAYYGYPYYYSGPYYGYCGPVVSFGFGFGGGHYHGGGFHGGGFHGGGFGHRR